MHNDVGRLAKTHIPNIASTGMLSNTASGDPTCHVITAVISCTYRPDESYAAQLGES